MILMLNPIHIHKHFQIAQLFYLVVVIIRPHSKIPVYGTYKNVDNLVNKYWVSYMYSGYMVFK